MHTPVHAPVRWGILGTANIARGRMIPAMHASEHATPLAIASRDAAKAARVAQELHVPRAYGAYEDLLADPDIDAIYNPLPNHLHVPWTIRAARAGKHVLCEKPIALTAHEARTLLDVRESTGLHIGEAFMVRSHPRWHRVKALAHDGSIGTLRAISGHFSYPHKDETNIRNRVEWGGGALLDIGIYPLALSRWLFNTEPTMVMATIDRNPDTGVDALVAAIVRFPTGTATFTCSGELVLHQSMQVLGTTGRIEVPVPFNPSETSSTLLIVDDGRDLHGAGRTELQIPIVNQFVAQIDAFVGAIRGERVIPVALEDSIANMRALDALFRSAESGMWEEPAQE